VEKEECYNLKDSKTEETFQDSLKEEEGRSIQLIDTSSSLLASCRDLEHSDVKSLGNIESTEPMHSFNKGSNDSALSTTAEEPALSDAGGTLEENHKDETSLADAEHRHDDGNTSVTISESVSPLYFDSDNFDKAEQSLAWNTSDEEMRLRFSNKRHRNGNPSCTYEAFKPTRFNLYTNSDEPSWSTIKKDNSLESSSPTIKKKSVTAKLNPLIGARLARDESPPSRRYSGGTENHKYTVTQKYEDKIRALQQQRQKERSRRRNYSNRGAENLDLTFRRGENIDLTFSPDIHPPPYAELYKYGANPTASLPAPSYYFISDEGDSVRIQLSDFVLGSPQVKNEKKKKGKEKPKDKASSPPVDNGYHQPHYVYNTENRPRRENGILQNLESHKRILQSYGNGHYEYSAENDERVRSHENNGNCIDNKTDRKQSYKHETIHGDHDFISQRESERENSEGTLKSSRTHFELSNKRTSSPDSGIFTGQTENGSKISRTTGTLQPNETVQHVTVKSRQISRPLSPRPVMAETKDLTFKEFSSNCRNEDVASFLVENIKNEHVVHERSTPPEHRRSVVHERVSMNCDVADVAKNISKHLMEFGKDDKDEVELLVTDLDAPDAASPLSRNDQRDVTGNGKILF
jgi:hypothetical protein